MDFLWSIFLSRPGLPHLFLFQINSYLNQSNLEDINKEEKGLRTKHNYI